MSRALVLVALAASAWADECSSVNEADRIDCGYVGIDSDGCGSKGCCWAESDSSGVPWCFFPSGSVSSCFSVPDEASAPFSSSEVATMRGYFLENVNIDGSGAVVAAPDANTPGGSYYYHWERDGALTMRCLQETASSSEEARSYMQAYTTWVLKVQAENDPNDQDVRIEPKYTIPDGEVYTGAWCRPQNDGPGLRAISLMIFAEAEMDAGNKDFIAKNLWTSDMSTLNGGAIKYDLDYIVEGWDSNTCDLWEEVQSNDFFWNRVTMKKAMLMGASFAAKMGDSASAESYNATAAKLDAELYNTHWTGEFVMEESGRQKDGAVIVGFNDGYADDGLFAPTSLEVASTVSAFNQAFCNEYAVNSDDTAAGLPGVLYGRYPGDTYAGGNPWVLTTAALANLFYRGALDILASGGMPSEDAQAAWVEAFALSENFPSTTKEAADLFLRAGDGVLLRLRSHVKDDGFHLDEQIDRATGKQTSAGNLTWSYAEVLNAMKNRGLVSEASSRSILA